MKKRTKRFCPTSLPLLGSVFTEFPGRFLMGPTAPSDTGGAMSPITLIMRSYVPRCMTVDLATGIAMQRSHLSAQVNEIFIWLHFGSLHSDHFKLNVGNCDMRLLRLLRLSWFSVRISILGKECNMVTTRKSRSTKSQLPICISGR